jgi:CubicO group peptidase (beta-lactamase class C family)
MKRYQGWQPHDASRRSVLRGLGATLATPWLAGVAEAAPLAPVLAWVGLTSSEYLNRRAAALQAGYCFRALSIFGYPSAPYYNAVMIRPSNLVSQHDYWGLTAGQFGQVFGRETALGYGPVILGATGSAANPLFVAVFEPQNPRPLTYTGLSSGSSNTQGTIQQVNALAQSEALILRCAASYGDSANPAFAGVWVPNYANTRWNNDGVNDNLGTYQARLNAQLSGWCRLSHLTLNQSGQYLSCFADDKMVGGWYERHGLGRAAMDYEVQAALGRGFVPNCLQAAGANPASANYAAIFTSNDAIEPRRFTVQGAGPNGPAAAAIDAIIMQSMQGSPVRDASIAIVHGTQLVYARGYTLAESNWPMVSPMTHFRMASVSKTVAALAIFQLIEERKIELTTFVQDILKLTTPTGSMPDPQFCRITIQHLLEHTSGLYAGAANQPVSVRNAFIAAGRAASLPVTPAMTDSYIAGLPLCASPPGSVQFYSNAGYYLLGRVVARMRNVPRAFDAYQLYLFNPLSITRIRPARSLLADQYPDEARYRDPLIPVYPDVMSDAQPLVPSVYGDEFLELLEGCAGLSGAATDIARLIAIMISPNDSPVLKRSTLNTMFAAGSAVLAAQAKIAPSPAYTACTGNTGPDPRAGYGFDWLRPVPGPATGLFPGSAQSYYGQKGGALNSSGNVLQFNGDWGFCMQWGGVATVPNNPSWYPDFPQIMSLAVANLTGAPDLFPGYRMPRLP